MSNCWKCGTDLPDGQTECEYLDRDKVDADSTRYIEAAQRFAALMGDALIQSGLGEFIKKIQ